MTQFNVQNHDTLQKNIRTSLKRQGRLWQQEEGPRAQPPRKWWRQRWKSPELQTSAPSCPNAPCSIILNEISWRSAFSVPQVFQKKKDPEKQIQIKEKENSLLEADVHPDDQNQHSKNSDGRSNLHTDRQNGQVMTSDYQWGTSAIRFHLHHKLTSLVTSLSFSICKYNRMDLGVIAFAPCKEKQKHTLHIAFHTIWCAGTIYANLSDLFRQFLELLLQRRLGFLVISFFHLLFHPVMYSRYGRLIVATYYSPSRTIAFQHLFHCTL